jgi:serine/threonine protein phosphatase PrpC
MDKKLLEGLPKDLKKVYTMADKCCRMLMMKDGFTAKVAERMVLEALKEHEPDLMLGNYSEVETALATKFIK